MTTFTKQLKADEHVKNQRNSWLRHGCDELQQVESLENSVSDKNQAFSNMKFAILTHVSHLSVLVSYTLSLLNIAMENHHAIHR
jgi:hypothetical protein